MSMSPYPRRQVLGAATADARGGDLDRSGYPFPGGELPGAENNVVTRGRRGLPPVPGRAGDRVTVLGHDRPPTWTTVEGALVTDTPTAARRAGRGAWVSKVERHA
ncbi:hypothetical protein ACIRQQ_27500 [Streptomyces fuscichromogenes]|uniref:hypothetical protein n=1 Tax=Streptomyces fuscichromogenes TaxID=1324013 RepID=UPI0037F40F1D